MSSITCEPGLNQQILDAMAFKVNDSSTQYKYCTLAIDEMSIKENVQYSFGRDRLVGFSDFEEDSLDSSIASYCTAILAQGLFENWKQPVGFWFVKSACKVPESTEIIHATVKALFERGLIVVALISDQGTNFQRLATNLGVKAAEPYFVSNEKKKIYLFDPPHLIKNTRNCLLQNDIRVKDQSGIVCGTASWSHISNFLSN